MDASAIRETWPGAHSVLAGAIDLCGIWRGKRLPIEQIEKIYKGQFKMPSSIHGVNIWGADPENSALVYEQGDGDCRYWPTGYGPIMSTWSNTPSAFLPVWAFLAADEPFLGDPRQALAQMLSRYEARGLRAVVAFELEFYIIDPSEIPPAGVQNTSIDQFENVLSLRSIMSLGEIFDEVYAACETCGIELDTLISEGGSGQYEVNFKHKTDPLRAADEVAIFKMLLRDILNKHELDVSYMAKTFPDAAGSGMHVHMSWLDADGRNLFDNGDEDGSPKMKAAVAGLLASMNEMMLVFAPGLNSYRRFSPASHAPSRINWGYDHRMTAIRIPESAPANRRIEHRVAGADANPYLVMCAILGGAMAGQDQDLPLPAPVSTPEEIEASPPLNDNWPLSIEAFEKGKFTREFFPEILVQMFVDLKTSEVDGFRTEISEFEYRTYLGL